MSVTDGVALFPRFPHLVEVGRIELPLGVRTTCRDLFPVTPATTSVQRTCLCTTVPLPASAAIHRTDKYCLTVATLRYFLILPPLTQAPLPRGQHNPFTSPLLFCLPPRLFPDLPRNLLITNQPFPVKVTLLTYRTFLRLYTKTPIYLPQTPNVVTTHLFRQN